MGNQEQSNNEPVSWRTIRIAQRLLAWRRPSPFTLGVILAVTIGVIAGLGAVAFQKLIFLFNSFFFDVVGDGFSPLGRFSVLFLPVIGGLVVGPLIYFFAREAKGHGVPEVMLAVAKSGGRMRGRVSVVKALASSICIGSGGSVGREGPIVQIGSSAASYIGQRFGVSEQWLRVLVACGAAGGISATFNAPIAGVFFALEVILRTFSLQNFGVVVLSSVTADVVAQAFLGTEPAFQVPSYALHSPWELGLYVLLGVGAALLAVGFMRLLYFLEDRFEDVRRIPEYLKPAVGGLAIGLIGVFYPQIFGVGYETISEALTGGLPFILLVALVLLKPLATSLTLGSGGSGGVFAPSLFLGAMAGVAFGEAVGSVLPSVVGPSGGYGLAGMAAVFAGAASAPITAILIVFEMTRDYTIILPLMLTVVVSTFLARHLSRENIYTTKLRRRGIDLLAPTRPTDPVGATLVSRVMIRAYPTVYGGMPVKDLLWEFERTGVHGLPVLNEENQLVGMVTITDVQHAMFNGRLASTARDIASQSLVTAYPEQTIGDVLHQLGAHEVGYIPVVDPSDPQRLLGMLRRQDIIRPYAEAANRRQDGGEESLDQLYG